ncbi:MAG: hypothetical protein BWY71_00228 [Planctomycetes bacterium ADurb.Bin412]|nr:MAG: hypothetical protein BWY71_00228 [Planctomycetes bacterium ADurb.Bin412]
MKENYFQLLEHIQIVRRLWRARRIMEGGLITAALGLAAAVLFTLMDQLASFGYSARWMLALLLWLVFFAAAYRYIFRPLLAKHSDDFFAALMESRIPGLGNRLINALQLGRETSPAAPKLVAAIVAEGLHAAGDTDPGPAVPTAVLRRNAVALVVVLLAVAGYAAWAGAAARTSFLRILLPGADITPFTWTKVKVDLKPGPRLLEGTPLTVYSTASGRIPQEADLSWLDARQQVHRLRMEAAGSGAFAYTFPAVDSPFRFSVAAGDARSQTLEIAVDKRPRLESMAVTYQYPPYCGLTDYTVEDFDGHLHGLPGTTAMLTLRTNKPLTQLTINRTNGQVISGKVLDGQSLPSTQWQAALSLTEAGTYRIQLKDNQGYEMEIPTTFTISLERDGPPAIALAKPGRDLQQRPDSSVDFVIAAQDDLGLGPVTLLGKINESPDTVILATWPNEGLPQKHLDLNLARTMIELGLAGGDRLQYWAVALDRNPGFEGIAQGPGRSETRKFYLTVLTAEQAAELMEKQLSDYAAILEELIRLQRLNRAQTAENKPPQELIDRQSLIRRQTRQLADIMQRSAFPGRSIVAELNQLSSASMVQAIKLLENYRDESDAESAKQFAAQSLPVQDEIIAALEQLLLRLNRNEQVRKQLKTMKKEEPAQHQMATDVLAKLSKDLDQFFNDVKQIEEEYEKMPKFQDKEELSGEDLEKLSEIEHQVDRWKNWFKDSVDAITKLPQGFVADDYLTDNLSTIFEEIEKQAKPPRTEIATPLEEGAKALAEQVAEDLEMWMPDTVDSVRWVMEDPMEGMFEVPETPLPSSLQDMIGDLIEDMSDFDEGADDITGAWGGNMQVGWGIEDGPISSFAALGKTGNRLPNASEMTGRSGAGRRGRASGQMVGDTSRALEGRPTPARLTSEPYEAGVPKADKQLDPRGATGGGKKTGGGTRGLQGGTPPDFVKDMERLAQHQAILREKAQRIARELNLQGKPLGTMQRAIDLMETIEQDYRDLRYEDAAAKRKMAMDALRQTESRTDQAVNLSLQKARGLPPELRQEITAGTQQALPEGYEDMVAAYYKAISGNAEK